MLTSDWLWQDHKERCIYTRTDGLMTGDSSGHQWANGNCATALGVICEAVGQVRTNQSPAPGHVTPVLTSDWPDGALHHGSAAHPAAQHPLQRGGPGDHDLDQAERGGHRVLRILQVTADKH